MPPRYRPLTPPEVGMLWLAAALAGSAVAGLIALHVDAGAPAGWWASRRQGRAMRAFASAVAEGDMAHAEVHARRALRKRAAGVDVPASKVPARWAGRRHQGALESWDDHVVLSWSLAEMRARISGPGDIAEWFAVRRAERPDGAELIACGLHMEVLSERWESECMSFRASGAGATISGYFSLRSVLLPGRREGVEVWVHVEAPASRRGRRLLRMARAVTGPGLRRLAAGQGPN